MKEKDIKNRVKSFDNAVAELQMKKEDLWFIDEPKLPAHIKAQMKIEIICEALNEGWTPDFTDSEQGKHYPYFEIDSSGFISVRSINANARSISGRGYRVTLKSYELARYAGEQFLHLYKIAYLS